MDMDGLPLCRQYRLDTAVYPRYNFFVNRLSSILPRFERIIAKESTYDERIMASIRTDIETRNVPVDVIMVSFAEEELNLSEVVTSLSSLKQQTTGQTELTRQQLSAKMVENNPTSVFVFVMTLPEYTTAHTLNLEPSVTEIQRLMQSGNDLNAFLYVKTPAKQTNNSISNKQAEEIRKVFSKEFMLDNILVFGISKTNDSEAGSRESTLSALISDSLETKTVRLLERIDNVCKECQEQNTSSSTVSLLDKLRFELRGVFRSTHVPTEYVPPIPPQKLSDGVTEDLFRINEINGLGHIYDRLHIHVHSTGSGSEQLKENIRRVLEKHGYSTAFIIQSVTFTLLHGETVR